MLWGVTALLVAFSAMLLARNAGVDAGENPSTDLTKWFTLGVAMSFATAGALIASQQPRNLIAWFALVMGGLMLAFRDLGIGVAIETCIVTPERGCVVEFAVLADAAWFALVTVGLAGLFFLFPRGELGSGWRRWLLLAIGLTALVGVVTTLFGSDVYSLAGFANPWHIENADWIGTVGDALVFPVIILLAIAVADFVVRTTRARGTERQQYKWLAAAAVAVLVGMVLTISGNYAGIDLGFVLAVAIASIPLAITIAILRYRLYDIDRLVNRTVVYIIVVAALAAFYALVVSASALLLPTASNDLAIAATVLIAAALFNPLRRRVQTSVDRRFYRSRYNTQLIAQGFTDQIRDEVDPNAIVSGWIDVVSETVQPECAGVWIRDDLETEWRPPSYLPGDRREHRGWA